MNKYYTYTHSTPDGSIFYVGKGSNKRAFSLKSRNKHWHNTVNKYGYNVNIEAYWNTDEEAKSHEILLIFCFKDIGMKLVNQTFGGEGVKGYCHTEKTKEILRQKALMQTNFHSGPMKEEQKKILSEIGKTKVGKLNSFYGHKHSEEAKEKNRQAHLGKSQSKESNESRSNKMKAFYAKNRELYGHSRPWLIKE
jgi:hypothetical protein